jgi:cytochrome c biogenesis protein CcmG, thiol:disulfide interchange protein DsbE
MELLRKLFAWGVLVVALGVIVLFARPSYRQGEASVAGKSAQDFGMDLSDPPAAASPTPVAGLPGEASLSTKAGRPTHLSDFKGKVVVLNFWATWCPPCVEEAPALNHLQQRIASRGGVIIGISIDDDPAKYEKFLKDFGVPYPTWRDPSAKVMHDYGTIMIPETYIIDRHGRIARKIIGPQRWDSPELTAYFDYLLAQS